MKRVALHTLGCKLNLSETATISRQFTQRGFVLVDSHAKCDVYVINTCSVTEKADRECRQLVRRALRRSPEAYVIVIGCYAQLQPGEISAIPGVDLILGSKEKFHIFDHVNGFEKKGSPFIEVSPIGELDSFEFSSTIGLEDRTRGFLKIQDGCNYGCSFCTIPLARGESRSASIESVVHEAQKVADQGYQEIVLTGVNVGDYGQKIDESLLELLRVMVKIDGLKRIRISSIEPNLLDNRLLDFWFSEDKICKHFHIPLQSGSDEVLRMMRRRYKKSFYEERILKIKELDPQAGVGADVVVGFPGETVEMFEETYAFVRDLPISYLHVFSYSARPSTPASLFEMPVEPKVRAERSERLRQLSARKRRLFHESFAGKSLEVLFETIDGNDMVSGLTREYVRVLAKGNPSMINRFGIVTIDTIRDDAIIGSILQYEPALSTLQEVGS